MQLIVVSVFDNAAAAYGRPVFVAARGQAVRSFTDEIQRTDASNEMAKHPEDFELYELGVFDDSTGRFSAQSDPTLLVRGKDLAIVRS